MAGQRCPRCRRTFRVLDDEVGMHACPSCGYPDEEEDATRCPQCDAISYRAPGEICASCEDNIQNEPEKG